MSQNVYIDFIMFLLFINFSDFDFSFADTLEESSGLMSCSKISGWLVTRERCCSLIWKHSFYTIKGRCVVWLTETKSTKSVKLKFKFAVETTIKYEVDKILDAQIFSNKYSQNVSKTTVWTFCVSLTELIIEFLK